MSKLSFKITGTQCSDPTGPDWTYWASNSAAIAKATQVSDSWLQGYANACYEAAPKAVEVIPTAKGKLSMQMTDFWEAYVTVIPCKRHEAVGQNSGLTTYIERLNNTLR